MQSWKTSEFYKTCIFLFTYWGVNPWCLPAEKDLSRRKSQAWMFSEVHAWFWGHTGGIQPSFQAVQEWANQGGNGKFRSRRQIPAGQQRLPPGSGGGCCTGTFLRASTPGTISHPIPHQIPAKGKRLQLLCICPLLVIQSNFFFSYLGRLKNKQKIQEQL